MSDQGPDKAGIDVLAWSAETSELVATAKAAVLVSPHTNCYPGDAALSHLGSLLGAFDTHRFFDTGGAEYDAGTSFPRAFVDEDGHRWEPATPWHGASLFDPSWNDSPEEQAFTDYLNQEFETDRMAEVVTLRNSGRLTIRPRLQFTGVFDFGDLQFPNPRDRAQEILYRLNASPGRTVIDNGTTIALRAYLEQIDETPAEIAAVLEPHHPAPSSLEQTLIMVAHHQLVGALPFLHTYPAELVVHWADELEESLTAYRHRVHELMNGADAELVAPGAAALLDHVGRHLDAEYDDLVARVQGHSLWAKTRDDLPKWVGSQAIGLIPGLYLGLIQLMLVSSTISGGYGLRTALEALIADRQFERVEAPLLPTYWRYRMEPTNWSETPSWWTE